MRSMRLKAAALLITAFLVSGSALALDVSQSAGLGIEPNGLAQSGGLEIEPNGVAQGAGLEIEPNGLADCTPIAMPGGFFQSAGLEIEPNGLTPQ